ncbi:MAG TPA: C4-dicarboxylate ABC transporter [Acidobacteria bacterium]|jgi:C4-dicarboxylate-binding protein DctP|nr:C4-dicarboxylate ABC transporter [Acidobacteriota bacterium]HAK55366.1 C4-dicarboxylate ABC transporter [Acidobacteriota bacterium]
MISGLRTAALVTALAVLVSSAPAADAQPVTMRIQHSAPLVHQITLALHAFAQDVEARSSGEVVVDILTRPRTLVPGGEVVAAVASGALEAAAIPNFQWTDAIPEMNFSVIPYLFTDLAQIRAFSTSPAAELLEDQLNALGARTLIWMHVTRTSLITSQERPIVAPADFAGLRVRTVNEFAGVPLEAVDAVPQRLGAGSVYAAIEAGTLDAITTDVASAVGLRLYEVQGAGTVAPYFSAFYHLFVNPGWLDGLSARQRKAVDDAAAALEATTVTITEARAAASIDVLRANGMDLHLQTEAEQAAWRAAMQPPALEAFARDVPDGEAFLALLPRE